MLRWWVLYLQMLAWGLFFLALGIAMPEEEYKRVLFGAFGGVFALLGLFGLFHPSRRELVLPAPHEGILLQFALFYLVLGIGGVIVAWLTSESESLKWIYVGFCLFIGFDGIGLLYLVWRTRK